MVDTVHLGLGNINSDSGNPSFLHLAATDRGGAGIAAVRVHRALIGNGFKSKMVLGSGVQSADIAVVRGRAAGFMRVVSKAKFKVATRPQYYFRNQRMNIPSATRVVEKTAGEAVDAIVSHALTDFMSFDFVSRLARRYDARVLWSLMDMASFTGGCHYAWDCQHYQIACGNCPALRIGARPRDYSAKTLSSKQAALVGIRSTVVAASSWLANQARGSALFRDTPIEIVPLSVSPDIFAPRPSIKFRTEMGLSGTRPVVFFGARDHRDARKGMDVLKEALMRLAHRRAPNALPTLLIAGDGAPFEVLAGCGFEVRQLGLVDPEDLALAYAAADLYVSPSIEDSGPMMINEAVMSGTPVVAFDVGVARDLIERDVTGMIAQPNSAEALYRAISDVLDWNADRIAAARARAREIGLSRCSPFAQAQAFARLASRDDREALSA